MWQPPMPVTEPQQQQQQQQQRRRQQQQQQQQQQQYYPHHVHDPMATELDNTLSVRNFLQLTFPVGARDSALKQAMTVVRHAAPASSTKDVLAASRALAALQVLVQHADWLALCATVQGTRLR